MAYRAKRRESGSDQEAHEAAAAAVQSVLPLPWKEASAEAVNGRGLCHEVSQRMVLARAPIIARFAKSFIPRAGPF